MRLLVGTLVVLLTLIDGDVSATCIAREPSDDIIPRHGQHDAPLSAQVWVVAHGTRCELLEVFDRDDAPHVVLAEVVGTFVEGRETIISEIGKDNVTEEEESFSERSEASRWRQCVRVFSPARPLRPCTTYEARFGGSLASTFTTCCSPTALIAQVSPRITEITARAKDWGEQDGVQFQGSFQLARAPSLVLVGRDDWSRLSDPREDSFTVQCIVTDSTVYLSVDERRRTDWPSFRLGETTQIHYAAVDAWGCFRGWSEPARLEFPLIPSGLDESDPQWIGGGDPEPTRWPERTIVVGTIVALVATFLRYRRRARPT